MCTKALAIHAFKMKGARDTNISRVGNKLRSCRAMKPKHWSGTRNSSAATFVFRPSAMEGSIAKRDDKACPRSEAQRCREDLMKIAPSVGAPPGVPDRHQGRHLRGARGTMGKPRNL